MQRTTARRALAITAVLFGLLAPTATASERTPLSAAGACGKIDWSFTRATVFTHNVSCSKTRKIARNWLAQANDFCDQFGCDKATIRGYSCSRHDRRHSLKLVCRRGPRWLRVTWGD